VLFGALAIDALDKRANIVSKRAKFVAFSYVGSSASEMARANSSFQKNKVMQIFNVRVLSTHFPHACAFSSPLPSSSSSPLNHRARPNKLVSAACRTNLFESTAERRSSSVCIVAFARGQTSIRVTLS
jgi:hypothetical protein